MGGQTRAVDFKGPKGAHGMLKKERHRTLARTGRSVMGGGGCRNRRAREMN